MVTGFLAELPLGLNPWLLLVEVMNFLLLWYILQRWVFPALFKTLDQRQEIIRAGVEQEERARGELAKAELEAKSIIEGARQESVRIIDESRQTATKLRDEIEREARARAEDRMQNAEKVIAQEIAQAKNSLKGEVADIAIAAASKVLGESLDGAKQRKLVQEFLAQGE